MRLGEMDLRVQHPAPPSVDTRREGQTACRGVLTLDQVGSRWWERSRTVTEVWDWRESSAQYSHTIEGQGLQHAASESPEVMGPGHQPSATSRAASQDSARRLASEPDGVASPQDSGSPLPVAQRGGRGFSIAAFVCGG